MPDISNSLEYGRTLRRQEKAREESDLWAAILALSAALEAAGIAVPEIHTQKAQEALLRAEVIDAGELPDTALAAIATVGNARLWAPAMGQIFRNEPIIAADGSTYICTQPHLAQAGWEPGTEGGRTLFRLVRSEPESGYLDFARGEHVPYGSVRRDPTDGKLYTPIHPEGITLYEPHYPNLVPSQYTEYTAQTEPEQPGGAEEPATYPKWSELPDRHTFNVGDYFTDYSKTYHVLRQFNKQSNWRPPALLNDFYEEVTA